MNLVVTLGTVTVALKAIPDASMLSSKPLAKDVWQFEFCGQSYTVVLLPQDAGLELWWRGQRYPVRVEREAIYALRRHFKAKQGDETAGYAITAHMPGLVTQVKVTEGQAVKRGEGIIVLEAMKMENELNAPAAGIISQLNVRVGEQVEKGRLLCVIRPGSQE